MARTYSQLYIHVVFAVKGREALIDHDWKEELHRYLTGIVQHNDHKVMQINSMPDHMHLLLSMKPHQSLSVLVQNLKVESSKWIRYKRFCKRPFSWQEGYGAFSYAKSQVDVLIRYIQNQEVHHKNISFLDEYKKNLTAFNIDWDVRYIFHEPQ